MPLAKNPKLQYLKLRGGTWYLNHPIPKDLQSAYVTKSGKPQTHIVRALNTGDEREAYRRKVTLLPAVLAEFDLKRRELRGMVPKDLQVAIEFREKLRDASNADDYELASTIGDVISMHADTIYEAGGENAASLRKARNFVRIAEGAETLLEAFDDWIAKSTLPPRTQAKYRTALMEFTGYVGGHPLIADMNRKNAIGYVDWLNSEARSQRTKKVIPLSYNTKRDRVMALSAFWNKGLSTRGKSAEPVNPWSKLEVTLKPTSKDIHWDSTENTGRPKRRDHFDEADLLAILDAPGPAQRGSTKYTKATLMEVFSLGLLTGARPDEFCSLLLGDVRKIPGGYSLSLMGGKNEESDRRIPVVHPLAVAVLKRRIGKRTDAKAQLFEEFRPKQGHDNMAELVLRALGRHLERAADLPAGAVPYCTRHTLSSVMGNIDDVKDAVLQRYIGQKPDKMLDKHYRSVSDESLLSFAKKVKYPAKVERRMAEELCLVVSPNGR
ncbi:DUF6538 domain-containing protein [Caldimonas sp. KR1-144]|uniref:DUF6538 domain-containing protein n=1 Tax=Caldimonas sp. KR1-144 TaxID=3400911 RepID=UPI003C008747